MLRAPISRAFALLVATSLLAPSLASAQDSEVVEAEEPSHGFAAGNFNFFPGVFLQLNYDNNLFYEDDEEFSTQTQGGLTDAFLMYVGATLRIESMDKESTQLNANIEVGWEQYFTDRLFDQSGLEVNFDLSALFSPQSVFAWSPRLSYRRTNSPTNALNEETFNNNLVSPGIEFSIQPGGGDVFSQKISYDLHAHLYEEVSSANKLDHEIQANTRWNFLPQTALVFRAEQHIIHYFQDTRDVFPGAAGATFALENAGSTPIRLFTGISGLFLRRLDITALVGYAYTAYDSGNSEHLPLAQVGIGYKWSDRSGVRAGYQYNFTDSTFGDYFKFHRGLFEANVWFLPELEWRIDFSVDSRTYTQIEGLDAREEILLRGQTVLAYTLFNQLRLGLTYQLTSNISDFSVTNSLPGGATVAALVSYTKHVAFLNVAYEF